MRISLFSVLLWLIGHCAALAANTYTVAMDATTATDGYVTMRQSTDQVAFKVTNTGNSLAITSVKFFFVNNDYNTNDASTIPSGWARSVTNNGSESSITFTGGSIAIGGNVTFPVTLRGDGNNAIETTSHNSTDSLSSMTVTNGSNTFTLQGSFPTWIRHGLLISSFTPSPATIGGGQNTTYTLSVRNVSQGTDNDIVPGTMTQTSGTGSLTYVSGPAPASLSLSANGTGSYAYVYSGNAGGTVVLSNSAGNGFITAPSFAADTVTVNTLTAAIDMDSNSLPSGYTVTVTLTVTNASSQTLTNLAPGAMTTGGTATKTLISGPGPASVVSLPAGHSAAFVWQYMITGSSSQTYSFTNSATADGGQSSSSVTTATGTIEQVYATVTPEYVGKGSTNTALDFQCYNSTGLAVKAIRIRADDSDFVALSGTSTDALFVGWTTSISGKDVTFTSPGTSNNLASGKNGALRVTYSSFPSPDSDTEYPFDIRFTKSDNNNTTFSDLPFSVTLNKITLAKNPDKNLVSKNNEALDITATVTNNGTPASNIAVAFSSTDGKLSASSVNTNASGQATTSLTAPNTPTDIEATITATINSATESTTVYIDGTNAESSTTVREKY